MAARKRTTTTRRAGLTTVRQVSAGGVAFRASASGWEVVLISVGATPRWQLPKGLVESGESPDAAAVRETREETGIDATVVAPIETIEYWYVGNRDGGSVRYHKFVHFFLMQASGGDVADHDHEVHEARWASLDEAARLLAFPNERRVVARAAELIVSEARRS